MFTSAWSSPRRGGEVGFVPGKPCRPVFPIIRLSMRIFDVRKDAIDETTFGDYPRSKRVLGGRCCRTASNGIGGFWWLWRS